MGQKEKGSGVLISKNLCNILPSCADCQAIVTYHKLGRTLYTRGEYTPDHFSSHPNIKEEKVVWLVGLVSYCSCRTTTQGRIRSYRAYSGACPFPIISLIIPLKLFCVSHFYTISHSTFYNSQVIFLRLKYELHNKYYSCLKSFSNIYKSLSCKLFIFKDYCIPLYILSTHNTDPSSRDSGMSPCINSIEPLTFKKSTSHSFRANYPLLHAVDRFCIQW